MFLLEHEGKELLKKFGVKIPRGVVVGTSEEAYEAAKKIGGKVAVKVQVEAGGRGKAGGIKFVNTPEEAHKLASQFLGQQFKNNKVHNLLIEETIDLEEEFYAGIIVDRNLGKPVGIISSQGGMDIEEVAARYPEKIARLPFSLRYGLEPYQVRRLAKRSGIPSGKLNLFADIFIKLWKLFLQYDVKLIEINPLALTTSGEMLALDSKIIIDDDAFYRQPILKNLRKEKDLNPREKFAKEKGYGYVEFNYNGTIACAATGAGLAMTSMDLINDVAPNAIAFFVDIGGRFVDSSGDVLKLAEMFPNIKAILLNRYGGFGQGKVIAESIVNGLLEVKPKVPVMVQLSGSGEKAAIEHFRSMESKIREEGITFLWSSHIVSGKEGELAVKGGIDTVETPVKKVLEWAGYTYERKAPDWLPEHKEWEQKTREQIRRALKYRPEKEYKELASVE